MIDDYRWSKIDKPKSIDDDRCVDWLKAKQTLNRPQTRPKQTLNQPKKKLYKTNPKNLNQPENQTQAKPN